MKASGLVLFIVGIAVVTCGFAVSHTDHLGWVASVVTPGYNGALDAAARLRCGESVDPEHSGFIALSEAYLGVARSKPRWKVPGDAQVARFTSLAGRMGASTGDIALTSGVVLHVELSSGRRVPGELGVIEEAIRSRAAARVFTVSALLFALGLVLEIWGYARARRSREQSLPN